MKLSLLILFPVLMFGASCGGDPVCEAEANFAEQLNTSIQALNSADSVLFDSINEQEMSVKISGLLEAKVGGYVDFDKVLFDSKKHFSLEAYDVPDDQ